MTARWSSRSVVPTPEQRDRRRLRRLARRAQGAAPRPPGIMDHGSNPCAQRKARDGARRAEREGPR